MSDVTVFVQTCPERDAHIAPTLESLRQSDAEFKVLRQPEDQRHCRFFLDVLREMASVNTRWVIRLEDDVLVSKHLVHNFLSWPALREPDFGVGWLFTSEMVKLCTPADPRGFRLRGDPVMPNAFGVGLHYETARACVAEYERWIDEYGCGLHHCTRRGCEHHNSKPHPVCQFGQDALFSRTAWGLGARVFLSVPSLVEARIVPTVVGTVYPPDTDSRQFFAGPDFNGDWRRDSSRSR